MEFEHLQKKMYTYRVTVDGISNIYSLSIAQLQGIYTYRSMYTENDPNIQMERIITMFDPKVVASAGIGMFRNADYYEVPLDRPLTYDGVSIVGRGLYSHYPPQSENMPKGLSIRVNRISISEKLMYTSIITKDLSAFLSGFLFAQMLCERSYSLVPFAIFSSQEKGYIPLSPLTGFPFLELPPELINMITDYYPCDWPRVSRRIYAINGSKTLFDPRHPGSALRHVVKTLNNGSVSDSQVDLFAHLIRTVSLPTDTLHEMLSGLKYHTVYPKIVDAVIDRYSMLPGGSIDLIQGVKDLIFARMTPRVIAPASIIKYLINDKRYSDILYFKSPHGINERIIRDYGDIYTLLFEEGFTTNIIYADVLAVNSRDEYLAPYVEFILNKKGVFEKSSTNPITGTTHPGAEERSEINVVHYVTILVKRAYRDGLPQTLSVILHHIDDIPDGNYLADLLRTPNMMDYHSPPGGDMVSALRAVSSTGSLSKEDENLLKKVYHKVLTSPFVSIDDKNNFIGDLDNIARKYGYSDDLVTYIRSIPSA